MKIVKLEIDNVKRIRAFHISPDGRPVVLTGKNGAGKSSVLDGIEMALQGKKVSHPILSGQSKGKTTIEMDNGLIITKSFTEKGDYLKVENKDGKVSSPAALLKQLVGEISFDPLDFARKKGPEQKQIVKQMDPNLDFSKLEKQRQDAYEMRSLFNRQLKQNNAEIEALGDVDPAWPDQKQNAAELIEKLNVISKNKIEYQSLLNDVARKQEWCEERKKEIKRIQDSLQAGMDALIKSQEELKGYDLEIMNQQYASIKEKIDGIDAINNNAEIKIRFKELQQKALKYNEDSNKFTDKIKKIDEMKEMMLANAKLPVKGLSITDNGIAFNGIDFDNLATSEQLKISFAMAMGLNPEIKVVFIRDGSLLDQEGKELIFRMAEKHGFQVWMEVTDDSGQVGIVIEDGMIKKMN